MRLAEDIERRLLELAAITAVAGQVTRLGFTPEMTRASDLVLDWMREGGMAARRDGAGNVVGRYESDPPGAAALMIGSHLDTVEDAGRYDGTMGVVAAIACIRELYRRGRRFPFAVEIMGFGEEEGVRFGTSIAGSRAVAGQFDPATLSFRDRGGTSARDALAAVGITTESLAASVRTGRDLHAYVELHIEQGPALEDRGVPLGCVTGIAGATRLDVTVAGMAGHAGTVPMALRRDALAAGAECILAVEAACRAAGNVVGTVGAVSVVPGSSNVVPGHVRFPIDVRSGQDAARALVADTIREAFGRIAQERGVAISVETLIERSATPCAPWLMDRIDDAIRSVGAIPVRLPSGAGHDAILMSALTDIGMIFVRCRGGISHNPAEAVALDDIDLAARALLAFIEVFAPPSRN